ncbi:hypothetical protein AAE478_007529 [Parahypoxylon ruwenzoriense]
MIADLLHSLTNDTGDSDGVAQLVVTALGSCGQHYVCWKTQSGEFKQQSNGLPKALQEWLFPADGSTRDFETLQVVLSGDDTFWASDRDGEIRSEPPSSQQQRLRRALTISGENLSPTTKRRMSRARELAERGIAGVLDDAERPRSSTLPSMSSTGDGSQPTEKPAGSSSRPEQQQLPSPGHNRSSSVDKLRKVALVPLAFNQQRRSWATRPRSMVYGAGVYHHEDLSVVKEQPGPERVYLSQPKAVAPVPAIKSASPPRNTAASHNHNHRDHRNCSCTCHSDEHGSTSAIKAPLLHIPISSVKPRSSYADASVQTDPPSPSSDSDSSSSPRRRRRRHHHHHQHRRSSVSSAGSVDSFHSSTYNSQRASLETTTTRPDDSHLYLKPDPYCHPYDGESGWARPQPQVWMLPPNPIMMGRMQDYFRSSTYVLGGALM